MSSGVLAVQCRVEDVICTCGQARCDAGALAALAWLQGPNAAVFWAWPLGKAYTTPSSCACSEGCSPQQADPAAQLPLKQMWLCLFAGGALQQPLSAYTARAMLKSFQQARPKTLAQC